jgi:PAS domain S-box-containing protein
MEILTQRSFAVRYLMALLAPALMAGVMQITWPLFEQSPIALFLLAIMFCGWYGGLGPGLLSMFVSFVLADYFFMEPYFSVGPQNHPEAIRLAVLIAVGASCSVLSDLTRREKRRAEINLDSVQRAEEARRQSEANYRAIFEGSALPMWVYDIETLAFIAVNEAAVRHYGYSRQEFLAMTIEQIRPPQDVPVLRAALAEAAAGFGAVTNEWRHTKKEGSIIEVETTHNVLHFSGRPARLVVVHDVTERRQMENAIRSSEESLARAQEIAHLGNWDWDLLTNKVKWSAEMFRIYGIASEEFGETYEAATHFTHPDDMERSEQIIAEALRNKQPANFDYRIVRQDGAVRVINAQSQVYVDKDGRVVKTAGTVQDITERKDAEESLREAEQKYRKIFENAAEGIFQTGLTGGFIRANPALARMLGYDSPEELIQERGDGKDQRYYDPERHDEFIRLLKEHSVVRDFEYEEYRKDGSRIFVSDNVRAVRDREGKLLYFEGTTQDISERKVAEIRSAAFATLAEKLSGARAPLNAAQTIADTARELFGWESCTLDLYDASQDLVHPLLYIDTIDGERTTVTPDISAIEPTPRNRQAIKYGAQLTLREAPYEFDQDSVPFGDTRRPSASVMSVPIRHASEVIGVLSIQSYRPLAYDHEALSALQSLADHCGAALNRIGAEEALRESEERYRELFENAKDATYVHDLSGIYTSVNRAAEKLTGCSRDEIIGTRFTDFVPPEQIEVVNEHLCRKLVEEGETTYETEVIAHDGRRVPVEVSSHLIYENGIAIGVQGTARDITERKRAEDQLRQAKDFSDNLIQTANVIILTLDVAGSINIFNQTAEELTGYTAAEVQGRSWFETLVPRDRYPYVWDEFTRLTNSGLPKTFENPILTKSGEERYIRWQNNQIIVGGEVVGTISFGNDITERKRAEEALQNYPRQLIEAQEAERQSIARELHDQIGQVLTAIRINLQTVWETCETSESRALIDEGVAIVDNALEQVRDLSFELRPSLLDDLGLVAALRWYSDRFARRTGIHAVTAIDLRKSKTRLRLELETACFRIVQEALTNVVRHARARKVSITLKSSKNEVSLSIKDDGRGFDAHSPNLYQFTTHLGLRGMRERALALGGRLEIESGPSRGTEIRAHFPRESEKD